MKKSALLFLFFCLFMIGALSAQTMVVRADSVYACSGGAQVVVPIYMEDFFNVGSIDLTIIFDTTTLSYNSYQAAHPALTGAGVLLVSPTYPGNKVQLMFFTFGAAFNGGTDTLIEFVFDYSGGTSAITWSTYLNDNTVSDPTGTIDYNLVTVPGFVGVQQSPTTPSPPVGETVLFFCQQAGDNIYTTAGSPDATSYEWSINPVSAGNVTGTGTTATVTWSNSFNGNAQVIVQGLRAGCLSPPSSLNVAVTNSFVGPASFSLTNPANGIWISETPLFQWTSSSEANYFRIYVDGILFKDNINTTSYQVLPNEALSSGMHTWYVVASNGCTTQSNETRSFLVDATPPSTFNLSSPSDNSWTTELSPTLSWSPSSDAHSGLAKYQLWIDGTLNRDNIAISATSTTPVNSLTNGAHTWEIRAVDNVGSVRNSNQIWTVNIDNQPPGEYESNFSCLYFDNNYVIVPHSSSLNITNQQLTLEAWINLSQHSSTTDVIVGKIGNGQTAYLLRLNGNKLNYACDGKSITGNAIIPEDVWTHVAITYDGSILRMYIDGNLDMSYSGTNLIKTNSKNVNMGKDATGGGAFPGYQDEIRIWNIARTQEQINEYKNRCLVGSETGLVGYWKYDEGSGTTIIDASIYNNNGTKYGPVYRNTNLVELISLCQLISPTNNQFLKQATPLFVWGSAPDAGIGFEKFQLFIDNTLFADSIADTTYTAYQELAYGHHTWYLKGFDSLGNYQFSIVGHFYIDNAPPNPFNLSSPADSGIVMFPTPNLSWEAATDSAGGSGMRKYQLWINEVVNRDSIPIGTTTVSPANALPQGEYTWFVKAYDNVGNVRQSTETRTFYVDWEPPTYFSLIEPANSATVTIADPVFRWHPSIDIGSGLEKYELNISGQTPIDIAPTDTFFIPSPGLPNGTYSWFVKAFDRAGAFTSSNTHTLTIDVPLPTTPGIPSGPIELCENAANTDYTTNGAAYATSYIWELSPTNAGTISGTGLTSTVNWNDSFTGNVQITVKGLNPLGEGPVSAPILIEIFPAAVPGVVTGDSIICLGQSTGTLTLSNYTGSILKWQKSYNGGNWVDIAAYTDSYSEIPVSSGLWTYRAMVKRGICPALPSLVLNVEVGDLPSAAGIISGASTVCEGQQNVVYSVPLIPGAISYQWSLPNGATGNSTSNTISVNYTSAVSGAISVRGINACGAGTASQMSISVQALPPVTILGKSDICMGESTLLQAQISQAGTYSYLWSPSGATTSSITVQGNVVGNIDYAVTVTDQYGCSSYGAVNVNTHLNPSLQITGDSVVCLGGIIDLTATASPAGTYTYLWSYQNVNTAKLTIPNLPAGNYQYSVTATDVFGCTATELINALVRTQPIPDVTIQGPVNLCLGDEAILTSVVVPAGNYAYQWLPGNQVTQQLSIQGDVVGVMNYTLRVVDSYGCTGIGSHSVTSNANPAVSIGGRRSINPGGSTDLTALPSPAGSYSYSWNPGGATTAGISVSPSQQTSYYVTVTDNILGCSASASAVVIINDDITLRTRVLLQGAYAGSGAMSTLLNSSGLLPHNQPFGVAPWNYPGQEHIMTIPSDVTDWVLVDLRSATDTALYRRAGLLRNDGVLLDIDGVPGLLFSAVPGDYYLAISHPRHLSVMSRDKISIPDATAYDFTDTLSFPVFGRCVISLSSDYEAMIAGDINYDKVLKYSGAGNDRSLVFQRIMSEVGGTAINATTSGYFKEDLRMDGIVKYTGSGNDPSLIIQNLLTLTGSNAINSTFTGPVPFALYAPPPCTPQPDQANAGPDSLNIPDTSIFLQANQPVNGTGVWSISSGTGGSFADSTMYNTLFFGQAGNTYALVWTVKNNCGSTTDTVIIGLVTPVLVCGDSLHDIRDGRLYPTVQIGEQCWMAENLDVGSMINGGTNQANNAIIEKYCYNNDPNNCSEYGGLYQWDEMMDYDTLEGVQGICPEGWHIATYLDWEILEDFLGGYQIAGGKMKVADTTYWMSPNIGATNSSGFSALGAGYQAWGDSYGHREYALIWSSLGYSSNGSYQMLDYTDSMIVDGFEDKTMGLSVRCVRDSCTPQAYAGSDSLNVMATSTSLQGNQPVDCNGVWSILSGTGGGFADSTVHNTLFYGQTGGFYTLVWTLENHCGQNSDFVNVSFYDPNASCGHPFTDARDGQQYPTIQIGTQCWMAKNLNVGTMVNSVNTGSGHSDVSNNGVIEKYCYNNDTANCGVYGGLYDWNEAMGYSNIEEGQGICPDGWHLPTDAEWTILENFLGGSTVAGGKMKETGTAHWYPPNNGATNSSGFRALAAGYRSSYGNFYGLRNNACFWSSSEYSSTYVFYRRVDFFDANLDAYRGSKAYGHSIRCLRDSLPPCTPQPDKANAGPDSLNIPDTSIILQANQPVNGAGVWSIFSGTGGSFADSTAHNTLFAGLVGNTYTLVWTISNQCGSTNDSVNLSFADTSSFVCGGNLIDNRDGQTYTTVQIGTQCWMAENLNVGTMVNSVNTGSSHSDVTNNGVIEKYCCNNDPANCAVYGGLYDWDEAMGYLTTEGVQGICMTGWHIPTDAEWCTMTTYLDATVNCGTYGNSGTDAGGKLKEAGFDHWNSPNTGATNSSGFTALGAGSRDNNGSFGGIRHGAYFWSSSENSSTNGFLRYLGYNSASVGRYNGNDKTYGFSVRCLADTFEICTPQPDQANAGPDSLGIVGDSVQLWANQSAVGSGQWAVAVGSGAVFSDSTLADTWFYGVSGANYTLVWTITNQCGSTRDTVNISFTDTSALTCGGILTDPRDGQQYPTIQIGTQCWMAKNLNVGTMINGSSNQTNNATIEKYCYNNDANNCSEYGGLYQWDEAMDYSTTEGTQGICPTGWHLPTDAEWCTLTTFLDPTVNCNTWGLSGTDAGGKMKETGTTHWDSPNTGATNSSGFTALGAGSRGSNGAFYYLRYNASFWSSSEYSSSSGVYRALNVNGANVYRGSYYKAGGFSVRCLRSN